MTTPPPPEIREEVSDEVNRATYEFLRRHRLRVLAGAYSVDLALVFRLFQVSFLESRLAQILKQRKIHCEATLDIDAQPLRSADPRRFALPRPPRIALKRPTRRNISQGTLAARQYLLELLLFVLSPLFYLKNKVTWIARKVRKKFFPPRQRGPIDYERIRRLYFVDAGEIKHSRIDRLPYTYHKYLEGIVDLNELRIPADTCIVLYGDLEQVTPRMLAHRRILLLSRFSEEGDRDVGPMLDQALWSTYFDDRNLQRLLGTTDPAQGRKVLRSVARESMGTLAAALRLISRCPGPLQIHLDTYDSLLFAVGQAVAEHFPQHEVVAMQRVLGPYTFSYNIKGSEGLFAQPSRILTWSSGHEEKLRRLGYTCELQSIGMFKLRKYADFRSIDGLDIRRRLRIAPDRPIVMFSVVQTIIGYTLIDRWQFAAMVRDLAELTRRTHAHILFKPWPGEDVGLIKSVVEPLMSPLDYTFIEHKLIDRFHNVELLAASDIMVSTLSSFLGEAWYFGLVPVLVNTRATETYFSQEYTDDFRAFCVVKDEDQRLLDVVTPLTGWRSPQRRAFFARTREGFARSFGDDPSHVHEASRGDHA